jgi:hypothetical protein
MGKVYHKILASSIANKEQIACIVPTEHLLVCSVSNWGGYALAAALAAVAAVAVALSDSGAGGKLLGVGVVRQSSTSTSLHLITFYNP